MELERTELAVIELRSIGGYAGPPTVPSHGVLEAISLFGKLEG